MADVVEQRCKLDKFLILFGNQAGVNVVEVRSQTSCEMVSTQRVSKSIVGGRRKDVLARGELLNCSQTLELGRVDDGGVSSGNQDVPVNLVANHAVSTLHDGLPSSRFFIALLGNTASVEEDNA
jgi:hypothetical protein